MRIFIKLLEELLEEAIIILVNQNTNVLVQGITGREGRFYT